MAFKVILTIFLCLWYNFENSLQLHALKPVSQGINLFIFVTIE